MSAAPTVGRAGRRSENLATLVHALVRTHRRALTAGTLALLVYAVLAYVHLGVADPPDPELVPARALATRADRAPGLAFSIVAALGPVIAMLIGGLTASGPFRWRLAGYQVVQNSRSVLWVGRLLLIWLWAVAATVLTLIACLVLAVGVNPVLPAGEVPPGPTLGNLALQAMVVVLSLGTSGTAATLVALVTRNGLLGVAVPLVESYAEFVNRPLLGDAAKFLPSTVQASMHQLVGFPPDGVAVVSAPLLAPAAGPVWSFVGTVLVVVVLSVLCAWRVHTFEPRS